MNKIFYTLLTTITLSFTSIDAIAIEIKGIGDCGEWVADKNKNNNERNKDWLLGYMSGLASASFTDVLANTSYQSIFVWMDNYCNANPLEHVSSAGITLFFELKKQKGLK